MSSASLDRKCQDGKIFLICIPCPAQCFRHDRQVINIVFVEVDTCKNNRPTSILFDNERKQIGGKRGGGEGGGER